jgi:hypothetical protein
MSNGEEATMAETYTGRVRNGVVVFDEGIPLEEGTPVRVAPIAAGTVTDAEAETIAKTRRMLLTWARRAEAVAPPMPADMAAEHDHYAHGKPRS